ncbi:uncharacterized protein RJT20DRAFT_54133 [Scheffersomyces xylosifermentans]|uniref:uncharacterized protein n=1 Tax=Scheffersomyces xylosifermentans TaxID=1304137 RepID=UPI00315CEF1E
MSVDLENRSSSESIADDTPVQVSKYDDSTAIKNYSTSLNLTDPESRPDIRNVKYKSPTDHLHCPICQQPFIEPLTTICGHTFCKECIFECFKMSKSSRTGNGSDVLSGCCPLDRTPIDSANSNDLFPTPLLITNLIDDLKVYCLNSERGCDWSGSRWELEHHTVVDCGYTGVRCGGTRCDEEENEDEIEKEESSNKVICDLIVERRFLSEEGGCIHKIFQCDYCNHEVTKITEQEHLESECLFNYQTCELCSNDMIALKNLKKHQENCSKIGHIQCPAHEIGCKWVGSNQTSLEIHLQNNNCQLNSFLPFYQQMNAKVDSLQSENSFLQKQINKILDSIIQGKITNLGYNESIEEINKFKSIEDQDKLLYLNFEIDRLKFELNEKILPFMSNTKMSERETLINNLVNDNFMMKEDLNLQRVLINSLRKQLQFLLFTRNGARSGNFGASGILGGGGPMGTGGPSSTNVLHIDDLGNDIYDMPSRSSSEERLNLNLKL